ncbi:MAG TPA: hypothetical protein PLP75_04505 [Burkholderiales bacterium]|nr:hypothetical protein [Burkholderiales bacterium]
MKQVVKKEFITEADLIKRGWRVDAIPFYLKAEQKKGVVDGILTNLYSKENVIRAENFIKRTCAVDIAFA